MKHVEFRDRPFTVIQRRERRMRSRRGGWPRQVEVKVGWAYYSYGRKIFDLTHSEYEMNVRRFTTFSLGEPLEYSCVLLCSNWTLEKYIFPWLRAKMKKSGGKWSVHLKPNWRSALKGPQEHGRADPVPMLFSFSKGEDGVLFRLFYDEIIAQTA